VTRSSIATDRPFGQHRALAAIAASQLLMLTLWFSASAVAPQLEADWGLSSAETTGLTLAVLAIGPALGIAAMLRLRRSPQVAKLAGGIG